ncbi:MAG: 2-amino-4-hydroxy-6-hydroxymethyldihydropteridine diphosphokinase [Ferrovum sp.]|nr:2-amino-4-hydroxy-6-hydroxymethyldihydropteridine diphosphokinase [Ferrovum sp.]NDU87736.1 2-amino-4-hydroxy-6-hydroxymethyldihydropteridine diphosphokinase [Ferrovum sp.]
MTSTSAQSSLAPKKVTAYIGLGSNLTDPVNHINTALASLALLPCSHLVAHSRLYRSAPHGHLDQPDFINAVARLETTLDPEHLLTALLHLEQEHGRQRLFANGPRTLDLDILLYGQECRHTANLVLPHPRLAQRPFVLLPWLEVAPATLAIPGLGTIEALAQACPGPSAFPLT